MAETISGDNWAYGTQDAGVPDGEEPRGVDADLPQERRAVDQCGLPTHPLLHTTLRLRAADTTPRNSTTLSLRGVYEENGVRE